MTKRLTFNVEVVADEDIPKSRVQEVLEAMVSDMTQDEMYESVAILDTVADRDKATLELVDMIEDLPEEGIDGTKRFIEEMEDDDE